MQSLNQDSSAMKFSFDSTIHKVKLQRSTAQTFLGSGRVWTVQTTQTQKV